MIYAVGLTLAFLALYFRSYWVRGRELVLVSAATVAMGMAFWPISHRRGAFFIYAAGMLAHAGLDAAWAVRGRSRDHGHHRRSRRSCFGREHRERRSGRSSSR